MEVGTADSDKPTEINRTVEWLTTTMQHLATKIAKLEARNDRTTSKKTIRCYPGPAAPRLSTTRHPRDFNEHRQHHDRQRPSTPGDNTAPHTKSTYAPCSRPAHNHAGNCCATHADVWDTSPLTVPLESVRFRETFPTVLALNDRSGNHLRPTINQVYLVSWLQL